MVAPKFAHIGYRFKDDNCLKCIRYLRKFVNGEVSLKKSAIVFPYMRNIKIYTKCSVQLCPYILHIIKILNVYLILSMPYY